MADNVFVLGLDDSNHELMRRLPQQYRFHRLLSKRQLMLGGEVMLPDLLMRARHELESFDGSVDAIAGYWDFPVSSMVPILCSWFQRPAAALEAVVKCEHKYWSRLVQREVTSACPPFALVRSDGQPPAELRYPMWVKPVKASASMLAYKVDSPEQFVTAAERVRRGSARVDEALRYLLSQVDAPEEIIRAGSRVCLAEEALSGSQVTVEGYCYRGRVHIYGLVDTITYPDSPSFLRYQYPSKVPPAVARRMADITTRVVERIGLDWCAFNVEFFWDPHADRISLLEINPRISQSHAPLFAAVDGMSNHQCMVRLALGRDPALCYRQGRHAVAAKWFLRRFSDGVVLRCPSPAEIERAQQAAPGAVVRLNVDTGSRLSDRLGEDSYSYRLAEIYVAARNETELTEKYVRCARLLPFEFDDSDNGTSP